MAPERKGKRPTGGRSPVRPSTGSGRTGKRSSGQPTARGSGGSARAEETGRRPSGDGRLSGKALRQAHAVASRWLERNAAAIDAINVFPVPDGDTGTNLALTTSASEEALAAEVGEGIGAVAAAIARGALLGARGNSGVILSQWWQGLAATLAGEEEAGGALLRRALEAGAESAYRAIAEPREGTLITVARAAARGEAEGEADAADAGAIAVLAHALALAEEAVERTPEQMPLLTAAGVVDAGGQGFAVLLQGLLYGLRGEALPGTGIEAGQIDPEWLTRAAAAADGGRFGYCVEFIVRGSGLETGGLRAALAAEGESLLVVGTAEMLHVHVHMPDPEAAYAIGARFGEVINRKADNMQAEHGVLSRPRAGQAAVAVASVAVASGEGFQQLFREIGVAQVVDGGDLFNPSAETLLTAARATHAESVILLPNDANVVPVAQQAARLAGEIAIHVLPTTSMPAGLTAALALEQGAPVEAALRQMTEAVHAVAIGGVSRAAREVGAPVALRVGQPFALMDGRVIAAGESINEALLKLIAALRSARPEATLLTLFVGAGTSAEEAEAAVTAITGQIDSRLTIEVTAGGQPHYPYLVSLE